VKEEKAGRFDEGKRGGMEERRKGRGKKEIV
jgi:hypothetical protein